MAVARPRADIGDSEDAKKLRETLRQAALLWFAGLGRSLRDVALTACRYTGEHREKTVQRRLSAYLASPPLDDFAIFLTVIDGHQGRGGATAFSSRGRKIIRSPFDPTRMTSAPHRRKARRQMALRQHLRARNQQLKRAALRCAKIVASQPELDYTFRRATQVDDAIAQAAIEEGINSGLVPARVPDLQFWTELEPLDAEAAEKGFILDLVPAGVPDLQQFWTELGPLDGVADDHLEQLESRINKLLASGCVTEAQLRQLVAQFRHLLVSDGVIDDDTNKIGT